MDEANYNTELHEAYSQGDWPRVHQLEYDHLYSDHPIEDLIVQIESQN